MQSPICYQPLKRYSFESLLITILYYSLAVYQSTETYDVCSRSDTKPQTEEFFIRACSHNEVHLHTNAHLGNHETYFSVSIAPNITTSFDFKIAIFRHLCYPSTTTDWYALKC